MSLRPCLSCWRRGRSVSGVWDGIVAAAAVGVEEGTVEGFVVDVRVEEADGEGDVVVVGGVVVDGLA